jgi:anti-sigma28 factor (negative regulator of flagellin synthesis)
MSDLSPISGNHRALRHAARPRTDRHEVSPLAQRMPEPDAVELSAGARELSAARSDPGVRYELVERVRHEIESGTYETDERIDRTVERIVVDVTA